MSQTSTGQRCRERILREAKALQKNLTKRKKQIAAREKLKQQSQNKEQVNGQD